MNHQTYPKGYRQIEVMDFMRNKRQMKAFAYSGLATVASCWCGG